MHTKCLIAEPIAKKEKKNLCFNLVVKLNFVPIVFFISKYKSVYIALHKRNHKVGRKALTPKSWFRPYPKIWTDLSLFLLATIVVWLVI